MALLLLKPSLLICLVNLEFQLKEAVFIFSQEREGSGGGGGDSALLCDFLLECVPENKPKLC